MKRAGTVVIIPPGNIEEAKRCLRSHVGMLLEAARWLEGREHYAASAYFSILCMEEISRHHVMSRCEDEGRGVTVADLQGLYDHREKLVRFLDHEAVPESEKTADILVGAKERALYFDFGGGSVRTLEALLGAGDTKRASGLLLAVAERGISATRPRGAPVPEHAGGDGQDPPEGVRPSLACLAAMLGRTGRDAARGAEPAIPHGHLDTALFCLEDHLGDLAKITHDLHAGGLEAASVFMGVMTIGEGSKYHLLARCRRERHDVTRKDMYEAQDSKKKLAAFLKHAARALGDANIDRGTGEYRILDPGMLKALHDSKKLAIHFVYMEDEAITLDAIFGANVINLADYVNETAQWIISWMVMSDGDAGDPYARHNRNPVHLERYERFGGLVEDPENVAQYHGWIKMTGLLKRLNDAAQDYDVRGVKAALAAIRRYGMWDRGRGRTCPGLTAGSRPATRNAR